MQDVNEAKKSSSKLSGILIRLVGKDEKDQPLFLLLR